MAWARPVLVMFVVDAYFKSEKLAADVSLTGRLSIGRAQSNGLVLDHASLSREHAVLELQVDARGIERIVLRDLGSTNGTYIDGAPVRERSVSIGEQIHVGSCRLVLRVLEEVLADRGCGGEPTIIFRGDPFSKGDPAVARLQALHELALALPGLDTEAVLAAVAEAVRRSLVFDSMCVVVEGAETPHILQAWDADGPCEPGSIELSHTLLDNCLRSREPVLCDHSAADDRFAKSDSVTMSRLSTAMCAPFRGAEGCFGALYCSSKERGVIYTRDDLQFFVLVACELALCLRHRASLQRSELATLRLESILDNLREGVVVCDSRWRIVSANRGAVDVVGGDESVGRTLVEVLEGRGLRHTFDTETIEVGQSFSIEMGDEVQGEPERSFHATVSQVTGLEEETWQHIVCIRNVTQMRHVERRRSLLTSQIAHKMRTPLTVISGVHDFVFDSVMNALDEEGRELVQLSRDACNRIRVIIDRFTQLSENELDSAGAEWRLEVVSVSALFDRAYECAASAIECGGLQVECASHRADPQLAVNAHRLADCVAELIVNAAKFSGPGTRVQLGCKVTESRVLLTVEDDGPGIATAHLDSIFDLFYQVDEESTGEVPGVGLGLWWAREIVSLHGGAIRIESPAEAGRGTRVLIELPRRLIVAADGDAASDTTMVTRLLSDLEIS